MRVETINLSQNLLTTPHGFYFRMKVPKRYRQYFQRREFKKSLKTRDIREAQRRAFLFAAQIEEYITTLDFTRGQMSKRPFLPFTDIRVDEVNITPNSFTIRGLELDPTKLAEESLLYKELVSSSAAAAQQLHEQQTPQHTSAGLESSAQQPIATAFPTSATMLPPAVLQPSTVAPIASSPSRLLSKLIEDFASEKKTSGRWKQDASNGRKEQLL
jgi:hypothetical protein